MCDILATSDAFGCDKATVTAVRDTRPHRGPDDAGPRADRAGRVALGHRRLLDRRPLAGRAQPDASEDGEHLDQLQRGGLQHCALRQELEGKRHVYRSLTDIETIVHLYEEQACSGPRLRRCSAARR
jgi:asparagine synthase (glutamine-hydrolysing)